MNIIFNWLYNVLQKYYYFLNHFLIVEHLGYLFIIKSCYNYFIKIHFTAT